MITPEQLSKSGTEHGEQCALFCWAQMNLNKYPELKWLHSSANGIFTTAGHKAKEKAAGMKDGVSDICLPVSKHIPNRIVYCGLYIELKKRDKANFGNPFAGATKEQIEFGEFVTSQRYYFQVAYGWEHARNIIVNYLEG